MKFDNFEINDKVWDVVYGWGNVVTLSDDISFQVVVEFENTKEKFGYTKDGRYSNNLNRTLFFEEIKIPESAYMRPRWRAEEGEEYFSVTSYGCICKAKDNYYEMDNLRFKMKNYFKSEEEAKQSKIYKAFHEEE